MAAEKLRCDLQSVERPEEHRSDFESLERSAMLEEDCSSARRELATLRKMFAKREKHHRKVADLSYQKYKYERFHKCRYRQKILKFCSAATLATGQGITIAETKIEQNARELGVGFDVWS